MGAETTTLAGAIKLLIRNLRSDDAPATVSELQTELRARADDYDRALETYERLRRHGEIYSYEQDGTEIVKITDDAL